MPLIKYATNMSARSACAINLFNISDIAVLEITTEGHCLYNLGELSNLFIKDIKPNYYIYSVKEIDIALGDYSNIFKLIKLIQKEGFSKIVIIESSLVSVLGVDLEKIRNEIMAQYNIETYIINFKLNGTYGEGITSYYNFYKNFLIKQNNVNDGYSLIGDSYSYLNYKKHQEIEDFLFKNYNLKCIFSSTNIINSNDINNILNSKFIIVTSIEAVALAQYIKETFNIDYFYFPSLGLMSINELISSLNLSFNFDLLPYKDDIYSTKIKEFKNIIEYNENVKIVAHLSLVNAIKLDKFFKEIELHNYEIYTNDSNSIFNNISLDQYIDKYKNKKVISISNEIATKYIKYNIEFEYLGLKYRMLTPLINPYVLINGAYSLISEISKIIFLDF